MPSYLKMSKQQWLRLPNKSLHRTLDHYLPALSLRSAIVKRR